MKEFFRSYFSFSRSQQRGVLFLSLIIVVLIALNIFFDQIFLKQHEVNEDYSELVKDFLSENSDSTQAESSDLNFREFNPNEASIDELINMGLTNKQSMNIINYREKVGNFNSADDLKKLYTIDEKLYDRIKKFIVISQIDPPQVNKRQNNNVNHSTPYKEKEIIVDVNLADTSDFKKLNGIGSYFAIRIVKFRDALGGFHSLDQLHEVYGLKDYPETIESVKTQLTLDPSHCNLIPINSMDAKELSFHPYFNKNLSNALINYRDQHGPFEKIEDVKKCRLVTEDIYPKIAPYLSLE